MTLTLENDSWYRKDFLDLLLHYVFSNRTTPLTFAYLSIHVKTGHNQSIRSPIAPIAKRKDTIGTNQLIATTYTMPHGIDHDANSKFTKCAQFKNQDTKLLTPSTNTAEHFTSVFFSNHQTHQQSRINAHAQIADLEMLTSLQSTIFSPKSIKFMVCESTGTSIGYLD